VVGKIDLSALNQSTRPKKKTKEEKRKEREEKAQQKQGSERKKRARIGKERIDINAAVSQDNANKNVPKDKPKKNKNKKRPQKPLEVNEEDVARQVKETLARLTNQAESEQEGREVS